MELWDAYYQDFTKADITIRRGQPIPDGLYHTVVDVIVLHEDGSYLFMRRDTKKPNAPGLWETGACGSVKKNEAFQDAAIRELFEETGIYTSSLTYLYHRIKESNHTIYFVYLCRTSIPKDSVVLQENETIGYLWLSLQDSVQFMKSSQFVPSKRLRVAPYFDQFPT